MNINNLAQRILEIFLVIGVAFFLTRKGLIKTKDTRILSELLILVVVPASIFSGMIKTINKDILLGIYTLPLAAIGTLLISSLLAKGITKLLTMEGREKRSSFILANTFVNTVYVGVPFTMAILGPDSLPLIIMYRLGHQLSFWTLGIWLLKGESKIRWGQLFKNVLNLPVITILAGVIIGYYSIPIPSFIASTCSLFEGVITPLALLYMGVILGNMSLRISEIDKSVLMCIPGKLFLVPLIVCLILSLLPMPQIHKKVIILQAALPTMMSLSIFTQKYNNQEKFLTMCFAVTTVFSIISLPIIAFLMERYL